MSVIKESTSSADPMAKFDEFASIVHDYDQLKPDCDLGDYCNWRFEVMRNSNGRLSGTTAQVTELKVPRPEWWPKWQPARPPSPYPWQQIMDGMTSSEDEKPSSGKRVGPENMESKGAQGEAGSKRVKREVKQETEDRQDGMTGLVVPNVEDVRAKTEVGVLVQASAPLQIHPSVLKERAELAQWTDYKNQIIYEKQLRKKKRKAEFEGLKAALYGLAQMSSNIEVIVASDSDSDSDYDEPIRQADLGPWFIEGQDTPWSPVYTYPSEPGSDSETLATRNGSRVPLDTETIESESEHEGPKRERNYERYYSRDTPRSPFDTTSDSESEYDEANREADFGRLVVPVGPSAPVKKEEGESEPEYGEANRAADFGRFVVPVGPSAPVKEEGGDANLEYNEANREVDFGRLVVPVGPSISVKEEGGDANPEYNEANRAVDFGQLVVRVGPSAPVKTEVGESNPEYNEANREADFGRLVVSDGPSATVNNEANESDPVYNEANRDADFGRLVAPVGPSASVKNEVVESNPDYDKANRDFANWLASLVVPVGPSAPVKKEEGDSNNE